MILVTGATGNIGSQLVKVLGGGGQKVRALVRDPKKAKGIEGKNVEIAQGDLLQPATLAKAFTGVEAAFVLVGGSESMAQAEKNAIDAAKKAGVGHVVLLSTAGANAASPIRLAKWHAESEANLRASGLKHTILQPIMFMQNLLGSAGTIKGQGKFYGAIKNGRIPLIDVADIASTAAAILTKPAAHDGKSYFLTGPEALTQAQVAEKVSKALGKRVEYVDIPSAALVDNLKKAGMPAWFAEDFGMMSEWFATDAAAQPSNDVETITGRKPRTFDAFIADAAAALR